jgi:hypothetical protein
MDESRPSRRRESDDRDREHGPKWGDAPRFRGSPPRGTDGAKRALNREVAANEAARRSKKECRVYVGNLSFNVRWNDLKDFMREGGCQLFASKLEVGKKKRASERKKSCYCVMSWSVTHSDGNDEGI